MRRRKPTTLELGSISSGTLRVEDLLPAMLEVLEPLRLFRAERKSCQVIRLTWQAVSADLEGLDWVPEGGAETRRESLEGDLDELYDIANAHCPDYCHCGSTEGDGAEIGVWPSWDAIDEAEHDKTIHRMNDQPPNGAQVYWNAAGYLGGKPDYVLSVNDHGNVTLYRHAGHRWIEVWSIV